MRTFARAHARMLRGRVERREKSAKMMTRSRRRLNVNPTRFAPAADLAVRPTAVQPAIPRRIAKPSEPDHSLSPSAAVVASALPGKRALMRYVPGMRMLGFLSAVVCMSACVSSISIYARASAGHIACPAENIDVLSAQDTGDGPRSWVAACGPKQYSCSSSGSLEDNRSSITCAPLDATSQER